MTKKVAVLGSTGSIGKNTLDVISSLPQELRIWGLSANTNWQTLAEQARAYKSEYISVADAASEGQLRTALPEMEARILPTEAFDELAAREADIVVIAVVGAAGLRGALAAARAGKRIALANKECLVMAGGLLMETARNCGAEVIPVDSEHSALFQAIQAGRPEEVARVVITASGGPFLDRPAEEFDSITVDEALSHPTWQMGRKITIDSATMVNKAFEVIEARWLFNLPAERISVLVHPESIVHSLVEFADSSIIAQLSVPDMRLPIQYALTWPRRTASKVERLDLAKIGKLTFRNPEARKFPCLSIGFEVAREGGTSGAVFNAANEVAVKAFLQSRLTFSGIHRLIRDVLDQHSNQPASSLECVLEADRWARMEARKCL
jgi:1-deoxy-D-xylulose-5-phosphate reductoisomerase